jgi:hypothetical protein
MANIKDRGGALHIRVGGNTQETATLVDSLPNGLILSKDNSDTNNPVCFGASHHAKDHQPFL